jgi:ELWxxDGT repeat protein
MLVKDIRPGASDSVCLHLTAVGNTLFFRATDGPGGNELWKSDGTAIGTVQVKNIAPGSGNSNPNYLVALGGILYFSASDSVNGNELWKSDGTSPGTVMVKDIRTGAVSSNPQELVVAGSLVFFRAFDDTGDEELWRSDGTDPGTFRLGDIWPGPTGSQPTLLTAMVSNLFFRASDGVTGHELWASDGTMPGTLMVANIGPGGANAGIQDMIAVGSTLYFDASDGAIHGNELWTSDGTGAGTMMLKDIAPGASFPGQFTAVGSVVFFTANDGSTGEELWVTDGTSGGTVIVSNINPASASSSPANLTAAAGNKLFFTATEPVTGTELWVINLKPRLPTAEPFDHLADATVLGKSNADGFTWVAAGPAGPEPLVRTGSLAMDDIEDPTGNHLELQAVAGPGARLLIESNIVSGSLYASLLLQVTDLTGLGPTGCNILGFDAVSNATSMLPDQLAGRLWLRSTAGGYNIGLTKTSSDPQDAVWDARVFTSLDSLLVVIAYRWDFDVAECSIMMDGQFQLTDTQPTPDLVSMAGPNQGGIAAFSLVQSATASMPASVRVDELNLGSSWLSVVHPGPLDYGDAPNSYHTLRVSNGPRHRIRAGWQMGADIDPDPDGMPSGIAAGDDVSDGRDDEDGVSFLTPFEPGKLAQIAVDVQVPTVSTGYVNVWVDFNANGVFGAGSIEHVVVDLPVTTGVAMPSFMVPTAAVPGPTMLRARLSSVTGLSFDGPGRTGEVEDYQIYIQMPPAVVYGGFSNAPLGIAFLTVESN